ncbi:hypothetical protein D1007_47630 [Hordeum vulgare]|nr:hypothetical protein D1007_47630 [Hordeum vulgare]
MGDARRVRAECIAARVVLTMPASPRACRQSAWAKAAATNPAALEQHASSMNPSMKWEGRTTTASSCDTRIERVNAQAGLHMAHELLRYRMTDVVYDAWLGHITELVTTAGVAHAPSRLLCPLRFAMEWWLKEHRRLLPHTTTRLSPDTTCT